MLKASKICGLMGLGLLLLWGGIKLYDCYITNCDGIIYNVNINVLFGYLLILWLIMSCLTLGLHSKHFPISSVSLTLISAFVCLGIAEFVCYILLKNNNHVANQPFHSRLLLNKKWLNHGKPFWGDYNVHTGRWRAANDTLKLVFCHGDTVEMATNSYGARDIERTRYNTTNRPRIVMMGDSFVEGYIVNAEQRHSNLMEVSSKREHLNFGLNGTSPINYYLTYKHLAKNLEHDVVTVGILPANDFEDYATHQKPELLKYPIYRPYWDGTFPNVSVKYSLAHVNQSISAPTNRNQLHSIHSVVDSVYRSFDLKGRILMELHLNSYLYNYLSNFYENTIRQRHQDHGSFHKSFFEDRWAPFEHSLIELIKEAKGKKVIFYTIPILQDLEAYQKNRRDDLSPRLQALCQQYGVSYINLLPIFYAKGQANWGRYYEPCDGHLTPEGERLLAQTLLNNVDYQKAIGIRP